MRQIHDVLYQALLRNAPYRVREELLAETAQAVDAGDDREAGYAAESLVTVVNFQRGRTD